MFCQKTIDEQPVLYGRCTSEEAAEPFLRMYFEIWARKSNWKQCFLFELYVKETDFSILHPRSFLWISAGWRDNLRNQLKVAVYDLS